MDMVTICTPIGLHFEQGMQAIEAGKHIHFNNMNEEYRTGQDILTGEHCQMAEYYVFEDMLQLTDWVREGRPSIVTVEHARHVIEIIEAGYAAAQTGQAQELHTSFTPLPLEALGE